MEEVKEISRGYSKEELEEGGASYCRKMKALFSDARVRKSTLLLCVLFAFQVSIWTLRSLFVSNY